MAAANLIELPRGSLYREKSGTTDHSERADNRLLAYRDAALEQGLSELRSNPEYEMISDYIECLEGKMWRGINLASWRSRFTDNKMAKARIDALAYLTDIKPTIDVKTCVKEYEDSAKVIQGVIHEEWVTRRMDVALEEAVDHALFGTGYWKIGCTYPGEFSILPCGMDTVLPIQQGKDLQDSTAVLYRAFRPPQFFVSRWPTRSQGIEREANPGFLATQTEQMSRPWNLQEYSWNSMSPAMRYHKIRQSPSSSAQDQWAQFPLIELQEFWIDDWHINEGSEEVIIKDPYRTLEEHNYWYRVKPGQRLYPRKRLLIFAGNRVMYDGPSPYWHGLFPFAKLRINPVVWSSGGLSLYRDLKPLNQSINRVGAGIENVVEKAIKPITITKDGAVNSTSWERFFTDKAGAKLKLTPLGNPATDVRFVDPPNLPGYVEQHRQYLLAAFREQAGQLDINGMGKKKQLPGGDTVEMFKDSLTSSRRRELRNLEFFLEDAGRIAVPCVAQFFSRDQRMKMLGKEGLTQADFDYKPGTMCSWAGLPEEFHKNFSVRIQPGTMHQGSKDRNKQVAIALRKTHDISRKELYRQLDAGINADQNEAELQQEAAAMPQPQPKGHGGKSEPSMTRGARNGKPY